MDENIFYSTDNKIKIDLRGFRLLIEYKEYSMTIVSGNDIIIYCNIYNDERKNNMSIYGQSFTYFINTLTIFCDYQKNMVKLTYGYSDDWGDGFDEELLIFKYNQKDQVWNKEN